ncbi:DUF2953 domain-containing protein [Paenibacillus hodogayensis]|uniref:DUF2953 domain-containing protein n=1 Tax=Paenibacillus hodogayensis TaxID=279208 RepID=A0ABV5W4V0_9BACL
MAWWAWMVAGILLTGMLLFVLSDVSLKVRFSRVQGDDSLTVEVKGLYGLVRYRYAVPTMNWTSDGLQVKTKNSNLRGEPAGEERKVNITRETVEQFFHKTKELLAYTLRLAEWARNVQARVVCTDIRWSTRVGLEDAADTAITVGVLWGLKTSALGFLFRHIRLEAKPELSIDPMFNRMHFSTEALCLMKIKAGYACYAGFLLVFRILRVKGGFRFWSKLLLR